MILDILQNRINTNFYLTQPVEQEKIDYIFECLRLAPSKQNRYPYKIIALPAQEKFKNWLVDYHTWCRGEKRLGKTDSVHEPKRLNKQYGAPLLLLWAKPKKRLRDDENQRDIEIGISTQIAVMAALDQGLGAGFGKCHDPEKIAEMLDMQDYTIEVVVGIGYAMDTDSVQRSVRKFWDKARDKWLNLGSSYISPTIPLNNYSQVSLGNNPPSRTDYHPRSAKDVSSLITVLNDEISVE